MDGPISHFFSFLLVLWRVEDIFDESSDTARLLPPTSVLLTGKDTC